VARKWGVVLLAGMVLGLSGCAVAPWNQLSDEEKTELRDGSSAYQQRILDDLHVSEDEYRQAVQDAHDCVRDAGAVPDPIEILDGDQLGFSFSITAPSEAEAAPISDQAEACTPEYLDAIGRIWVSQGSKLTE
jgi:hypothetical protein